MSWRSMTTGKPKQNTVYHCWWKDPCWLCWQMKAIARYIWLVSLIVLILVDVNSYDVHCKIYSLLFWKYFLFKDIPRTPHSLKSYMRFIVNFAPEIKETICEAKFLGLLSYSVPPVAINVALKEHKLIRYSKKVKWSTKALGHVAFECFNLYF